MLPRDLDPDPPCSSGDESSPLDPEDPLAVPLPRIIRVRNGADLKVKWCETCGTYRPPRSSHCRICDNCVENIGEQKYDVIVVDGTCSDLLSMNNTSVDHHCTFLNTCIGRRNYFTFFAFLIFSILACFFSIAFTVIHLYLLTRPTTQELPRSGYGEGKDFGQALSSAPMTAAVFILTIMMVIPLLTLFSYHVRLVAMNRTTVEQIRINTTSTYGEKADDASIASTSRRKSCAQKLCLPCTKLGVPGKDPNPFAYRTVFRNFSSVLGRPISQSWIDRRGLQRVDTRRPNPSWQTTN